MGFFLIIFYAKPTYPFFVGMISLQFQSLLDFVSWLWRHTLEILVRDFLSPEDFFYSFGYSFHFWICVFLPVQLHLNNFL